MFYDGIEDEDKFYGLEGYGAAEVALAHGSDDAAWPLPLKPGLQIRSSPY